MLTMKFIGLDLAWGEVAWTGTAVADDAGHLLRVGRQKTDQDLVTALRSHLDGPVLVAIDAPLIVTNRTGRRPCETLVSTMFGRFDAGAHSSNLSLPSFREGPRGARVAALLGLELDPQFPPQVPVRRAIEVYPHPATVTLFGLDRIIPYKQKPGRSAEDRRAAMLALMAHMASLATATPPLVVESCDDWAVAYHGVSSAETHADLNRWEDAIDAVLCAYIGLHRWWHGEARSAVLGDVATGYIVVPLDDRVRESLAQGPPARLSNAEVEALAVDVVRRSAAAHGCVVEDTRYVAGAVGDLVVDGKPVEIKASARSVRGEDLWLEPRQAQALLDGSVALALVEHVRADGSGIVRWVDAETLKHLLPRLREHRYFTLPVPVAAYDALASEEVTARQEAPAQAVKDADR